MAPVYIKCFYVYIPKICINFQGTYVPMQWRLWKFMLMIAAQEWRIIYLCNPPSGILKFFDFTSNIFTLILRKLRKNAR